MAIDGYMFFQDYHDNYLISESQVNLVENGDEKNLFAPFQKAHASDKGIGNKISKPQQGTLFEIEDYSFDIEQTLNIGSQSTGAGAGRVTFNPFSITRKIDCASPILFKLSCSGTPFQTVCLGLRKAGGGNTSGRFFVVFTFKLVAVKTISWAHDDESPKETVTFEYGGFNIRYSQQGPDGKPATAIPGGWNRVKNIVADDVDGKEFDIK
jgi:type VI secretion system secreted protein Hcp